MGRGLSNQSAPYFMTMRENERRMLGSAIDYCGSISAAADALGVTKEYIRLRALHLGGVLPGQPKREPPGPIRQARRDVRAESYGLKKRGRPRKVDSPQFREEKKTE